MRTSRSTRRSYFFGGIVLALLSAVAPLRAVDLEQADHVIIKKSERKLFLMKDDRIIKTVNIALGLVPAGDKYTEGDFKTPEGTYRLTERNPDSDYFLSILISYPNMTDANEARLSGVDPGGQIMIHGQPTNPSYSNEYYRKTDWTDGCIAVSNSDMVDVWLMTYSNMPIQILP